MDREDRNELKYLLAELLHGPAWRHVVQPAMKAQLSHLATKLALATKADLEEIRALQIRYSLIAEILEHPARFFGLAHLNQD